jgi:hypothetical protein
MATTPEARARINIDALLTACGWVVQNMADALSCLETIPLIYSATTSNNNRGKDRQQGTDGRRQG